MFSPLDEPNCSAKVYLIGPTDAGTRLFRRECGSPTHASRTSAGACVTNASTAIGFTSWPVQADPRTLPLHLLNKTPGPRLLAPGLPNARVHTPFHATDRLLEPEGRHAARATTGEKIAARS